MPINSKKLKASIFTVECRLTKQRWPQTAQHYDDGDRRRRSPLPRTRWAMPTAGITLSIREQPASEDRDKD
jgi:hypothetical protein